MNRIIALFPQKTAPTPLVDNQSFATIAPREHLYALDDMPIIADQRIKTALQGIDPAITIVGWFYNNDHYQPRYYFVIQSPNRIPEFEACSRYCFPNSTYLLTITRIESIPTKWSLDNASAISEDRLATPTLGDDVEKLTPELDALITQLNATPVGESIIAELAAILYLPLNTS